MTYLVQLRLLNCWHFDDLADLVVAGVALAVVAGGGGDFHDVIVVFFNVSLIRDGSCCWCDIVSCCKSKEFYS